MTVSYPVYAEAHGRPRGRWKRRLLISAVVLLVLLVGILVIADRVAAGVAERMIAEQLRQEVAEQQVESGPPEVEVKGFPFLTQVVSGQYQSISIRLFDVRGQVNGKAVVLPQLNVEARDVAAPLDTLRSGQGDVQARTVTGTATLSYGSVEKLIDRPGVQLSGRDGKLVVTAAVDVLGQEFVLNGVAELAVTDNVIQVRFDELTAKGLPANDAAKAVVSRYAQQISVDIPLPALPFQLDVSQVRALPEGLAVTASAQDVALNAVA